MNVFGLDMTYGPLQVVGLWYVRCLFLFVLISPLFRYMIRRFGFSTVIFFAALSLLRNIMAFDNSKILGLFNYGLSLSGCFYFCTGLYIREQCSLVCFRKMLLGVPRVGILFSVVVLLIINYLFRELSFLSGLDFMTFIAPILLLAVFAFIPVKELPVSLKGCAFGVFLMHLILLPMINIGVARLPVSDIYKSIFSFVSAVFIALLGFHFVKKHCPKSAKVIFGGR